MSLSVQHFKPLRDTCQERMAEREWVVATDLAARLVELAGVLKERPAAFTKRFGRARKQFYAWKMGRQLPGRSVLETAAENNDWPRRMFEEGGPRPRDAVGVSAKGRSAGGARILRESGLEKPYGPPARETIAQIDLASVPPDKLRAFMQLELTDTAARREAMPGDRILFWFDQAFEAGKRAAEAGRPRRRGTG